MKTPIYRVPFRPADLAAEIAEHKLRAQHIGEKAFEVLRLPQPDTFLGRQHYPFIPLPHDDAQKSSEDEQG